MEPLKFSSFPWQISKLISSVLASCVIVCDLELLFVKNNLIFLPVCGRISISSPTNFWISWFGATKSSSGLPTDKTRPSLRKATLLQICLITSIWCVTTTIVIFISLLIFNNKFKISLVICGSNADVASSHKRISGFKTSARAIATLCFCPPLNWRG